ncbi:hypothetical protein EHQ94_19745 [Leptospira meyeri]|uniref:hypothetical protein n=1 Tax=Leptospira meyeri TaxID=29508 RepID=UPI00108265AC|nr:hypothetical protein [Leptospira meyeri]TGM62961.1 hypothetical protein EHQ94_19745 [Leptospira meyeri]TGM62994.1 hypothetical protein EHQ93_11480 [Leptospira meyeri]
MKIYKFSPNIPLENVIEEIERDILIFERFKIDHELEKTIKNRAIEKANKMREEIRREGIPINISQLLNCKNKEEEIKLSKNLKINTHDFAVFIQNAPTYGYSYSCTKYEFTPEHLNLTEKNIQNLFLDPNNSSYNEKEKAFNKISETFKVRKQILGHLFNKEEKWHLFYLEGKDLSQYESNHWVGGPHIHYLSHNWGNKLDPTQLLAKITKGKYESGLHISFSL